MHHEFAFKMLLNRNLLAGAAVSPFAAYALAAPFSTQPADGYWVGGTQYPTIDLLPGYTFARTGEQGAVDASGAVQYFAANVPAINSAGYHAYGALTNYLLQSQALATSWVLFNSTVASDTAVAPDGTTTMDAIVETASATGHSIYQSINGVPTGVTTYSCFLKAGTRNFASLRGPNVNATPDRAWVTIDLTTGAVQVNAAAGIAGYSINCGGGIWRLVLVVSSPNPSHDLVVAASDVATAPPITNDTGNVYTGTASAQAIHAWQPQIIPGNHPDGGPIIRTTATTASIGASALATTTNPYTADTDFVMWAAVDFANPPSATQFDTAFSIGADATYLYRDTAGSLRLGTPGRNGGTVISGVSLATAGRAVMLWRRSGGVDTIAVRVAGVNTIVVSGSGVSAWPATTSALHLGKLASANELRGSADGVFARTGTFTDADINAILSAA